MVHSSRLRKVDMADWWDAITEASGGGTDDNYTNDGFNYGPFSTSQYSGTSTPDGAVATTERANASSWFDQSKLSATFSDILNSGVGAIKATVAQEAKGGQPGKSFFDVFSQAGMDLFSSSKTGQAFRGQVVQSQFRLLMANPVTWVAITAAAIGLFVVLRK
jgi:hypothetical protein